MSDKSLVISAKNMSEKDAKEIKANEVLNFLDRYSRLQWQKGKRRTRQLFPSFDIISKGCHLELDAVKVIIDYLEDNGEIIRDVSQRYLKWIWHKVQDARKKLEYEKQQKIQPVIENKVEEKKEEPIIKNKFDIKKFFYYSSLFIDKFKITILKAIMFIIGCIVFYVSFYFTNIWFQTMFSDTLSKFLSFAIVGTSITSFEMMLLFKQDKNYIGIILFFILWLGVVTFSITTGLSGQLSQEIEKKIQYEENNVNDDSKVLLYENYNNRIDQLNKDIESARKERDKLQEFISNSSFDNTSDKKEYKDLNYRIYLKNNDINKMRKEIDNIEIEKEKLLKENIKLQVTKKIDFFTWLEKILKVSSDKLRFILYLILAVFVDIISPVNFSIVLFYKRKV